MALKGSFVQHVADVARVQKSKEMFCQAKDFGTVVSPSAEIDNLFEVAEIMAVSLSQKAV